MPLFGSIFYRTSKDSEDAQPTKTMKVKNPVWLTADKSKAVPSEHPEAAFLGFGRNAEVHEADAKRLKLTELGAPGQKDSDSPDPGGNTDPDSPQGKPIARVEQEAAEARAKRGEDDDSGSEDKAATRGAKARK